MRGGTATVDWRFIAIKVSTAAKKRVKKQGDVDRGI